MGRQSAPRLPPRRQGEGTPRGGGRRSAGGSGGGGVPGGGWVGVIGWGAGAADGRRVAARPAAPSGSGGAPPLVGSWAGLGADILGDCGEHCLIGRRRV